MQTQSYCKVHRFKPSTVYLELATQICGVWLRFNHHHLSALYMIFFNVTNVLIHKFFNVTLRQVRLLLLTPKVDVELRPCSLISFYSDIQKDILWSVYKTCLTKYWLIIPYFLYTMADMIGSKYDKRSQKMSLRLCLNCVNQILCLDVLKMRNDFNCQILWI